MRATKIQLLATSALLFVASSAAAQTAPASPDASAPPVAATATDTGQIADIVVTAQKNARGESVQKIPIAITAVNMDTVSESQAANLVDVGRLVPNVQLQTGGSRPGYSNFTIRGLPYNNTLRTLDPTVSIVVDGVAYGDPLGSLIDTFDLASIEILRGPQGTLVGRNSIGGAVVVTTRRPGDDLSVRGSMRAGNAGRFDLSGSIEGPIAGHALRAKLAVIRRHSDGLVKDDNGGTFTPATLNPSGIQPPNQTTNQVGENILIVRPTIVWEPTSRLSVTAIGEYMKADYTGNDSRLLVPSAALIAVYGYQPPTGDYTTNQDTNGGVHITTKREVLEGKWNLGPGIITSISGWRHVSNQTRVDQDGTPFPIQISASDVNSSDQFSQEVRFSSDFSSRVRFVVGGYYSSVTMRGLEQRDRSSFAVKITPPFTEQFAQVNYNQNAKNLAAFANTDIEVITGVTISGGIRYTRETKLFDIQPFLTCTGPGFTGCPSTTYHEEKTWDDFSPRAALSVQASNDLMFYTSWTKGFRSGNFNGRAASAAPAALSPSDPESASVFEGGMKWSFWDRKAKLNVAVFHTKYNNIQEVLTTTGTVQSIINAAKATVDGAEVEFTIRPTRHFELDASFGWTDAKYDQFLGLDLTGDGIPDPDLAKKLKFPRVPKFTFAVAPSYSFDLKGISGSFVVRADYTWRDKTYVDLVNTAAAMVPAQGLLDASLVYKPNDRVTISLYGRNLTNAVFWDVGNPTTWGITVFGGQPRTYGVEIGFQL
ncbi:MAG: hypothetical protein JWR80_6819 [Bradyrhizobium sp.]|nr:hypothetical protein [Bradyrhizobium sp.]